MLSRLVCGRHISTDGGLVLAAEFIKESIENGELNGASMHINVPKKSVDQGLSEDPQISEKQSMRRAGQTENNRKEQALRKAIADSDATEFGRIIAPLGKFELDTDLRQ